MQYLMDRQVSRVGAWHLFVAFACLVGSTAFVRGAAPTISDFSPASGPVGTTVVIDGTGFVPPISITFAGNAFAAGSFTSTRITLTVPSGAQSGPITVQTAGGSTSTATNYTVGATTPVVTLAATIPTASVSGGQAGEFTVSLSSVETADTVVSYKLTGSAINGTDYLLLKGTAKIKAGKISKPIKVTPEGDLGGASKKTVKLTLEPGDGYTVGTTTFEKVKIVK